MEAKKYWWEKLRVARQRPRKKAVKPDWMTTPLPCTKKPVLKVPCYIDDPFHPKYVYKVKRTPAGWAYTYTYPSFCKPSWASELYEVTFDKYPPKVITKKKAIEKIKKLPDAEKILRKS